MSFFFDNYSLLILLLALFATSHWRRHAGDNLVGPSFLFLVFAAIVVSVSVSVSVLVLVLAQNCLFISHFLQILYTMNATPMPEEDATDLIQYSHVLSAKSTSFHHNV
jgi:hypothetical protein